MKYRKLAQRDGRHKRFLTDQALFDYNLEYYRIEFKSERMGRLRNEAWLKRATEIRGVMADMEQAGYTHGSNGPSCHVLIEAGLIS